MGVIKIRQTKFNKALVIDEQDIEWIVHKHEHYRIVITLHHISSGAKITQASDVNQAEAKGFCLRELQYRLCTLPPPARFCAWCTKQVPTGSSRKYCGTPCQQVARKNIELKSRNKRKLKKEMALA